MCVSSAQTNLQTEIDSKNIKNHRNDAFRLVQLLPQNASVTISEAICADMQRFLDADEEMMEWI